jgi:hypothetical protein
VAWANDEKAGSTVKLLFAISTPYMNDNLTNSRMAENNKQAAAIMASYSVPTANLYEPIVAQCGAPPQASCMGKKGCWSPHCPPGYSLLVNSTIEPAVRVALMG